MLYVARDESFMVIPKKILLGIDYLSDDIHEIFINIMWELITKVIKKQRKHAKQLMRKVKRKIGQKISLQMEPRVDGGPEARPCRSDRQQPFQL